MALVIDATVGGATANSFVLKTEMDAYVLTRLNAGAWTGVDAQLAALTEATRQLNVQPWDGSTVTSTQALNWPRQFVTNPDAPAWGTAIDYATTIIPQRVKDATCELALQFLKAGTTDIASLPANDGLIRKRVDVLEKEWADPRVQKEGLERYPLVWNLIAPLLVGGSSINFRTVRT